MTNAAGMQVSIYHYGGTVTKILTKIKMENLAMCFLDDSLSGYLQKGNPYFGCLVGRYGNHIAKGNLP